MEEEGEAESGYGIGLEWIHWFSDRLVKVFFGPWIPCNSLFKHL